MLRGSSELSRFLFLSRAALHAVSIFDDCGFDLFLAEALEELKKIVRVFGEYTFGSLPTKLWLRLQLELPSDGLKTVRRERDAVQVSDLFDYFFLPKRVCDIGIHRLRDDQRSLFARSWLNTHKYVRPFYFLR